MVWKRAGSDGARFGPAGLVVRDAAGLLGLTALGAVTIGIARAWFLPLGWTLAAILFPQSVLVERDRAAL